MLIVILWSIMNMPRAVRSLNCPMLMSSAEVKQGDALPLVHSPTVKNCPLHDIFSAKFYAILCFLSVILLLEMAPNYSVELLSSVSKHKKAVMSLVGKIPVLAKLHSSMSYSALSCEFNDNERI